MQAQAAGAWSSLTAEATASVGLATATPSAHTPRVHHSKRKSIDDSHPGGLPARAASSAAAHSDSPQAAASSHSPAAVDLESSEHLHKRQRHVGPSGEFATAMMSSSSASVECGSHLSRKRSLTPPPRITADVRMDAVHPLMAQLRATHMAQLRHVSAAVPFSSLRASPECKRAKMHHGHSALPWSPSLRDEDECISEDSTRLMCEATIVSMCDLDLTTRSPSPLDSRPTSTPLLSSLSSRTATPVSCDDLSIGRSSFGSSSGSSKFAFASRASSRSSSDTECEASHCSPPTSLTLENKRLRAMLLEERARRIRAEQQLALLQQRIDVHEAKQEERDTRIVESSSPRPASSAALRNFSPRASCVPILSPRIIRGSSGPRRSPPPSAVAMSASPRELRRARSREIVNDDESPAAPTIFGWHQHDRPPDAYLPYFFPNGLPRCLEMDF